MRNVRTALLGWLCVAVLGAQEPGRFFELVEVSEVEVPVRVLVKGKPLAGLVQEDFELYDEGELQTIVGFRVQEAIQKGPAQKPAAQQGVDVDSSGRRLLLLFDFSHTRPQRLGNALRGIRATLIKQLSPDDRVAVATYGYVSGVNLLVGFTADGEKLSLAFDAIDAMLAAKGKKQREILAELHARRFAGDKENPGASTFGELSRELGTSAALAILTGPVIYDEEDDDGVVVQEQESVWGPIKVRVEVDVREPIYVAQDAVTDDVDTSAIRAFGLALAELTTLLRDVGGQKEMILMSEGFSGALLENARSMFYLQKAFRSFRDSGWTLHGVDVGGVPGMDDVGFESNSLFFMTQATGGDLIENINNFSAATAQVLKRTAIVYVLAFQPREKGDPGEFRRLAVKLKNPPKGVDILHRPGYYSERPPTERGVFEKRMDGVEWLMSNLEANEIDVQVYAVTEIDGMGGVRVPVVVEIGGEALRAIETKKPTRVGLQLAILDADSRVRGIVNGEIKLRFSSMADTFSHGGLRFVGELGLPPGDYQLRVLVRSSRKGQVFLETFPLTVGADAENEILPPPAASERGTGSWITVEAERRTAYFQ